jgi:hypothetical protein
MTTSPDHPMTCPECVSLREERDAARQWVRDLQSGMYVNCVYCGHRYGPGETTPVSMADALKAHVEACPQHPMSQLKTALARVRAALEGTTENVERVAWAMAAAEPSPEFDKREWFMENARGFLTALRERCFGDESATPTPQGKGGAG